MADDKMLVDLDKPGSEEDQLEAPPDDVQGWLNEEVDVFDMAAEMLKEEGIHTIFGVTAGGCWNIEGHCLRAGIERVHVRTEETATFAADATWKGESGPTDLPFLFPQSRIFRVYGLTQDLKMRYVADIHIIPEKWRYLCFSQFITSL